MALAAVLCDMSRVWNSPRHGPKWSCLDSLFMGLAGCKGLPGTEKLVRFPHKHVWAPFLAFIRLPPPPASLEPAAPTKGKGGAPILDHRHTRVLLYAHPTVWAQRS